MKAENLRIAMLVLIGMFFSGVCSISAENTDDKIGSICNKFCNASVKINYKNTDYSEKLTKELGGLKIEELIKNLENNAYLDNQIPEALQYLGLKLMQDKFIDDSLKVYECAAEKYYDLIAMYRMARVYKHGTESIKKAFPDAVITSEINPDFKKAYFWVASMLYVEMAEKTGLLSKNQQLHWNSIAMLDDLQNSEKLSKEEKDDIENKVQEFIGKRYPEFLKEQPLARPKL